MEIVKERETTLIVSAVDRRILELAKRQREAVGHSKAPLSTDEIDEKNNYDKFKDCN